MHTLLFNIELTIKMLNLQLCTDLSTIPTGQIDALDYAISNQNYAIIQSCLFRTLNCSE